MKMLFFIVLSVCLCLGCTTIRETGATSLSPQDVQDTARQKKTTDKLPLKHIQVDTHGVALDTDADGVPDYKDKEVLTEQVCFPVDSTGVGVCPEPWCCRIHPWNVKLFPTCNITAVSIVFVPKSKMLSQAAKQLLDTLAYQVKANPYCKVVIGTVSSLKKAATDLSLDRINVVMNYLAEHEGVSKERLLFGYDLGDIDIVELHGSDARPGYLPAPPLKHRR